MKKVSYQRFEDVILPSCPGARIETRAGVEYVVIPTYDFDTDVSGEKLLLLLRESADADQPKFKPGDVLRHSETGEPFNVVDPLAAMMKLRKGPKAEDNDI